MTLYFNTLIGLINVKAANNNIQASFKMRIRLDKIIRKNW